MRWKELIAILPGLLCVVSQVRGQGSLDRLMRLQEGSARRASSSNPNLEDNRDARPIEPLGTLVLADLEGPGVVTHIWSTVNSDDPFYPRSLVLRVYYDHAERPGVESPLGDFFGVGHGTLASFTSLPVTVSSLGRARNCYWRMPFRRHVKITVTNDSPKYRTNSFYFYVDWLKRSELPPDTPYFHAQYRQATPARPGDYTILETTGRGHYVGTVYSAHQVEDGWFGEGDDKIYIDGEQIPSLRGTGTEDYFNDGWGFRQFSTPFYGVSVWEGYTVGGRVTAYRWHVEDPLPFSKSLRVTIEHKGSVYESAGKTPRVLSGYVERPDWISSVAFWYQDPPAVFDRALPPVQARIAPYRVVPATDLEVRAQPAEGLTRKGQITYLPERPDAAIEIAFDVERQGRYQLGAGLTRASLGGRYQPILNNQPLGGPIDCYDSDREPATWMVLGAADLEPGRQVLRFEGRGVSSNLRPGGPPVYGFGLRYLVLLRLEDLTGYHQALEKLKSTIR